MGDEDRSPAILTKAQRRYLNGEELADGQERAIRARIRERLQASIFDLQLIVSQLSLDDIDTALAEPDDYDMEPGSRPPVTNSMNALPALLYLWNRHQELEAEGRPDGWATASFVEEGIQTALARMGVGYDELDIEIHVERSETLETLAEGDLASYSRDQLTHLLRGGAIDGEQFVEAWTEKQQRDDGDEE